ncbi:MAG: polysaccharide pyruvyl transferase CsaB [Tissierellia bacterium]|nr:polysaccharide pyruvyl transferase CsaB [Tissierellia bacterium]
MKRLVLSGYFGFDNSGDDAILKSICEDLKKLNKDLELTVLSKSPEKTARFYGVNSVDRFSPIEVFKALKRADLFIFGGGSLLQDITSTRSLIYYLGTLKMAQIAKTPTYVFANGVGPISGKLNRELTKKILNKTRLITLRDKNSYEFLKNIGVDMPNMEITADPVMRLEPYTKDIAKTILENENIDSNKKFIALCLRNWKEDKLIDKFAKLANILIEKTDYNLLFVPLHYPSDLEFSKSVIENIQDKDRAFLLKAKYEAEEIMAILSLCDLTLAMRLHSLVYSINAETPYIGIIYDPKVKALMEEMNIDLGADVSNFDADNFSKIVLESLENLEELKTKTIMGGEALREKAWKNIDNVLKLLGEKHG